MELSEAISILQKHLNEDKSEGSYYYAWQANIAMAFKDEFQHKFPAGYDHELIHKIANNSAKNFLDTLIKQ